MDEEYTDALIDSITNGIYAVSQMHIYHLLSRDQDEHDVIGEFYPTLSGLVDDLAEQFIGMNGSDALMDETVPDCDFAYGEDFAEMLLSDYREIVTEAIEEVSGEATTSGLSDTLTAIQKLIDNTTNKLEL